MGVNAWWTREYLCTKFAHKRTFFFANTDVVKLFSVSLSKISWQSQALIFANFLRIWWVVRKCFIVRIFHASAPRGFDPCTPFRRETSPLLTFFYLILCASFVIMRKFDLKIDWFQRRIGHWWRFRVSYIVCMCACGFFHSRFRLMAMEVEFLSLSFWNVEVQRALSDICFANRVGKIGSLCPFTSKQCPTIEFELSDIEILSWNVLELTSGFAVYQNWCMYVRMFDLFVIRIVDQLFGICGQTFTFRECSYIYLTVTDGNNVREDSFILVLHVIYLC